MITVRNRDLGEIVVTNVWGAKHAYAKMVAFHSEAGELLATIYDDGGIKIYDPAYPKLRYNAERFRPLLMEALQEWQAASTE